MSQKVILFTVTHGDSIMYRQGDIAIAPDDPRRDVFVLINRKRPDGLPRELFCSQSHRYIDITDVYKEGGS